MYEHALNFMKKLCFDLCKRLLPSPFLFFTAKGACQTRFRASPSQELVHHHQKRHPQIIHFEQEPEKIFIFLLFFAKNTCKAKNNLL